MVVEECAENGCVGMRITAELAKRNVSLKALLLKNLGDGIVTSGTISELRKLCGIDSDSLVKSVMEVIKHE